jgi:serine/threonine-protein kinase
MQKLGRYEILAELGRGAMGTVFQARDPRIDRTVAIKTVTVAASDAHEAEEYLKRFFREAQAAGKLAHPGIVTVFDVDEEPAGKVPFIVMEFVAGSTLDALAKKGVAPAQALDYVKQVAEALHYAHANGIVHRDVKPANIIVTAEGRAKIMDFGVAKLAQTELTVAGQVLGTPSYMSPEQLTGEKVDGRSDLFSLGVVLYYLLTGAKPFTGESVNEVALKIVQKEAKPPSQVNPALTAECDYVIARAMAKSPAERYQTGQQFADDLEDLRNHRIPRSKQAPITERTMPNAPVAAAESPETLVMGSTQLTAKTPSPPAPAGGMRRRLPVAARIAIMAGLLLIIGAGMGFLFHRGKPDAPAIPADIDTTATIPQQVETPTGQTAHLRVHGFHPFYRGELSVYVDDKDLQIIPLHSGGARRGRFFFSKAIPLEGSFDRLVTVPAGAHRLKIWVQAGNGFEDSKEIEANFPADSEKELEVSFRRRELHLEWR